MKRFEEIFNCINVGIVVHDSEGRIISVNPAPEEIFGLKEERLKEKSLDFWEGKLYKENGEPMNVREFPISRVFDSKKPDKGSIVGVSVSEDEDIRWYLHSAVPQFNEGGDVERVITFSKDITDRKKSEEREAFLETLLRQDMRNKLGVSMGFLELLEEADLPEGYRPYLGKAMDSIGKGFDLVELAEEVRKTRYVEVEEINLCEALENAVEECEGLAKEKGVEIELDSEKRRNVRAGYPLKKIFLHMFRTGIYKPGCSKMRVLDEERDGEVVVRVEDDGDKIPDAVKEKISKGTYTGETSGIGGAIYSAVREIVRNFGGSVEVKDSELGGARFDVHLKKAQQSPN
ncbi:hypothetical protein AKJ58_01010 [candidate division MSBL1 archaeon SCGC-AAA385D11]|uniref:histidine kinase n=1 Tax=candidate division MSBL1 archaeon SCGC-AAA385D11 TaxID=1698286 RepID=A0A133VNQ4_9EURY|nr:hypothetical protein AKJ58_01010 [candidate division MSBL1 archaeon SCGC-AAA385D11]